ncbi:MAG TPA: DUF4397 domain-containing protein [Candidatus Didemnitutus sp.]|nr:DUF4397 domain-containing protein [Candidatus Didemnitutus sp.]
MVSPIGSSFLKAGSVALIVVIIQACTCSNDITTPREVDPTTTASIRCISASADAPSISVMQNDRPLIQGVSHTDTMATYTVLPSGIRNIRCVGDQGAVAFLSTNIDFGIDKKYTLVMFDKADRMRSVVMYDLVPIAVHGMAHIRLVHVADSTGSIILSADDQVIGMSVPYPTAGEYLPVPAGSELSLILQDGSSAHVPINVDVGTPGTAYTVVVDRDVSSTRVRCFRDR